MSLSTFSLPVLTVNGYLWDTLKTLEPTFAKKYDQKIPFFPLSDAASGTKSWENKPYIIYDTMLTKSIGPFYPIKNQQIIYHLKGNEQQSLEWGAAIQYILDRMDDAAQDVNDWNRNQATPANVYFHHIKVFQITTVGGAGSPAEVRDFSIKPYYITKFVIELQYHFTDSIESILNS